MLNGTNANKMKEKNRRLILNLIRQNPLSRAEISRITSLTKAAVSIIVDELINSDIIFEVKSDDTGVGRHPLQLRLNPKYIYALGINITRECTQVGIVDINGHVLCEESYDTSAKDYVLEHIICSTQRMITANHIPEEKIYGVGVCAPGPLDCENTTILNPPNFKEWHYENIGLRLSKALNKNIYLENVSGGLALCEKYFGTAKTLDNFILINVSDGIGSGIVNSGSLLRTASELGHTSICYNGIKCECGNSGCIEKYASIPSILKDTKYHRWQEVIDNNDAVIITHEADYLACGIVNAVNLFGFEHVILSGDITYKSDVLIAAVNERLKNNTIVKKPPLLIPGSSFYGSVCAAATVFDSFFSM